MKAYKHIRPLEMSDLDSIMEWVNDKEVTRNIAAFSGSPITREEEKRYLETMLASSSDKVFAVLDDNNGYIGNIGLHQIYCREGQNVTARLAMMIGKKSAWGQGYAQKVIAEILDFAFSPEGLGVNKVWLMANPENGKNVHLYDKCGFKLEARLVQEYFHDGKFHDMLRMYMLREDYNARQG